MSSVQHKKVLIAEDDPMQARIVQQSLTKAGATVEIVADGKAARDRLARGGFDAFVTDWMMPELDGIELARELKTAPNRPVVILVTALNAPGARGHALQAGADEFLTKPLAASALVDAIVRCLTRRPQQGTVEVASTPAATFDHPVAQTPAWKNLPQEIRKVAGGFLGVPVDLAPGRKPTDRPELRGILPLVDVEHLLELHVRVEASMVAGVELARVMLGDPPPDDEVTLQDLVSEVANVVAGGIKTAFVADGFPFTLGLTSRVDLPPLEDYAITELATLRADKVELAFAIGIRPRNAVALPVSKLQEGMILADNIRNERGAMVLPLGTRLTVTVATRLQSLLRDRTVRVCIPEM
jgi:CheY-like chemotaxis protein